MDTAFGGKARSVKHERRVFTFIAFFLNIGEPVHPCDSLRIVTGYISTSCLWWAG